MKEKIRQRESEGHRSTYFNDNDTTCDGTDDANVVYGALKEGVFNPVKSGPGGSLMTLPLFGSHIDSRLTRYLKNLSTN